MAEEAVVPFRFLDLPNELRLKLYRFILPRGERIHLDPDLVQFPIPYVVEESYGTTFDLLRVCKTIHAEATEFIFRHNTVNIIGTKDAGNFLEDLGITACQYITKLECHVGEGLGDLGEIWATMSECPQLKDIRLVFYHERSHWLKTLAELVHYYENQEDGYALDIDIELHTSIWARHYSVWDYAADFSNNLSRAQRFANIYGFEVPRNLRHITLTASVSEHAADTLLAWDSNDYDGRFSSQPKTDTTMKKTLRYHRATSP